MHIQITESWGNPLDGIAIGKFVYPRRFEAQATGRDLAYAVVLRFTTGKDGPVCDSLTLTDTTGGSPITSASIRSIPVGRILRISRRLARTEQIRDASGVVVGGTGPNLSEVASHESRPWKLDDEFLSEVAAIYKKNLEVVRPSGQVGPTQAVADRFRIDAKKASRWVTTARRRGLLPPAGGTR